MKITNRPLSEIKPYENNPRINDEAVAAVAKSIREFGFRQPIVVDRDDIIIVGHTRFKAAVELGLEKVPVHVARDLTAEQIQAYRIADNKSGELAEWDFNLLVIELSQLNSADYDLGVLGFDPDELAKLLNGDLTEGLTDADDVPEPPDEPITQRGDLWILGDHRLLCGDSSDAEQLDRLLDGARIDLINTDPPYNVKVEPRSQNAIAAGNSSFAASGAKNKADAKMRPKDRPLENDFVSDDEFDRLLEAWFGNIGRVSVASDSVFIAPWRKRARPLRRQRIDSHRSPANRPPSVPNGTRPTLLRRHCRAMGEVHR